MRRPWLQRVVLPTVVLLMYFLVPVATDDAPAGLVLGGVVGALGLAAVGLIIFDEARRAEKRLRLVHLLLALELVLVLFAFGYYALSVRAPAELHGLATRLDALYFSATTTSTVGFGDIHAVGQVARAMVTVQIMFSFAFVAALISLIQGRLKGGPPRDG